MTTVPLDAERTTDVDSWAGLYALQSTQRAMRRLHPDPVAREDVLRLIQSATRAPSGQNLQPWDFIVVTDPELRRRIGRLYKPLWKVYVTAMRNRSRRESWQKMMRSGDYLAEHLAEAPVLIVVCSRPAYPRILKAGRVGQYGSVFPAIQNLMLAARALGLGATPTTLHLTRERAFKRILGIPRRVRPVVLMPVGFPRGRFGEAARLAPDQVLHWDRWDAAVARRHDNEEEVQ
jgi:nitroreductase